MSLKSSQKIALITGVNGQDGAYLTKLLLEKGYIVHGLVRRSSTYNLQRLDGLLLDSSNNENLFLHYGDMTDTSCIINLLQQVNPREIYNLAAQSHVAVSFEVPEYTANVDGIGSLRILEAVRILGMQDRVRIYQASTSELYGKVQEVPQTEKTPFYPRSPYGAAKLYAYWVTINYREAYNFYASNGILFNHESPIRGETFVTRKISRAVAKIYYGIDEYLTLGNLDAKRDWGHAKDYAEGMWMILQANNSDDYVLATGEAHSVREFVELAFYNVGIAVVWEGKGINEVGINKANGKIIVNINSKYFRPSEVDFLLGDSSKAKKELGWTTKVSFESLVKEMVESDLKLYSENQCKDSYGKFYN